MYRSIVVGYDGSDNARDAVVLSSALAQTGASVTLVNAFYDIPTVLPADDLRRRLREDAERTLAQVAHELPSSERVSRRVVTGRSPARSIYELAEESGADLVVLGSSRRAAAGSVMAGGVGAQVVDGAPCAVAHAAAGLRERRDFELRRVGIAFDGEAESKRALSTAADIARSLRAELRVLTVTESAFLMPVQSADPQIYQSLLEGSREEAERTLDDALAAVTDVPISGVVLEAPIGASIVEESRRGGLDLLVVGSRRYGPLRRLLLGSVSRALLHSAPCSLLVVPRGGG